MISRRCFMTGTIALALVPLLPPHAKVADGPMFVRRRLRATDRAVHLRLASKPEGEFQLLVDGNGLWIHDITLMSRGGRHTDIRLERHVPPRRATAWLPLPADLVSMTVQVTNLPLGKRSTVLELRTRSALPATGSRNQNTWAPEDRPRA